MSTFNKDFINPKERLNLKQVVPTLRREQFVVSEMLEIMNYKILAKHARTETNKEMLNSYKALVNYEANKRDDLELKLILKRLGGSCHV